MMCILHGSLSFSDTEWITELYKSGLAMLIMVGGLALESTHSSSFLELRSVIHKSWFRFSFCCARKRMDKGSPAPELPDIQGFSLLPSSLIGTPMLEDLSQDEDGVGSPYPVIEIYDTREKSVEGIIRRRELHIDPTTSVVSKAWERKQALEAKAKEKA
jgi:hypothetical protein